MARVKLVGGRLRAIALVVVGLAGTAMACSSTTVVKGGTGGADAGGHGAQGGAAGTGGGQGGTSGTGAGGTSGAGGSGGTGAVGGSAGTGGVAATGGTGGSGGCKTAADCDDGNSCTTDSCDSVQGCVHKNAADNTSCTKDGDNCTDDVCKSGQCTHPTRKDGSQCTHENTTGADYFCCAGKCVYTASDAKNCGGCYVTCNGTPAKCTNAHCRSCSSNANPEDCANVPALNAGTPFTCNISAGRCECAGNSSCPMSWQYCDPTSKRCLGQAP